MSVILCHIQVPAGSAKDKDKVVEVDFATMFQSMKVVRAYSTFRMLVQPTKVVCAWL